MDNSVIAANARTLPTLQADRLSLRWLTAADVPALLVVFGDPEVCRYWSRPALANLGSAEALLREIQAAFASGTLFQWGIALGETGAIIGTCTLASISVDHRRAEVGIALARSYWSRGYASEALGRLVHYAFDELALNRVEADADPRNGASLRVLEKTGFRREGIARERYWMNGEFQDALLYGLLRQEWLTR